ncbi:WecB/TagA/CpsF family glycosyltransferase [Rhodopila sp.]|uniref:WecB/TagA/CpsF family glycosyltransferase n=1 Tax=Rhodopila sp. TaxID=2480087 RepID=UPI003D0E9783
MIGTVRVLGLEIADLTVAQAAAWLAARPADAAFGYVVTPNADHLVRMSRDARFREACRQPLLCVLDSRVVRGLGKLIGLAMPAVVPGSDLTAELLAHHLRPGERITIVGLSPAWLPGLMARCGLAPPAHHDPAKGFERDPEAFAAAVAFVNANPARFVFLAVGSPRQEYLAAAISASGRASGTGLCVGASLEFLAGARRRAPRLMRWVGMEWLFRLAGDPRRLFRRYLIDSPAVVGLLLRQRLGRRGEGGAARAARGPLSRWFG